MLSGAVRKNSFTERSSCTIGKFKVVPLVIDDGSTDNTADIVKHYCEAHKELPIRLHRNAKNRGLAYSYVDMGPGVTGVISTFDGFSRGNVFKFNDITSHDLTLGVRWNFDQPQPVYQPPLVRKG